MYSFSSFKFSSLSHATVAARPIETEGKKVALRAPRPVGSTTGAQYVLPKINLPRVVSFKSGLTMAKAMGKILGALSTMSCRRGWRASEAAAAARAQGQAHANVHRTREDTNKRRHQQYLAEALWKERLKGLAHIHVCADKRPIKVLHAEALQVKNNGDLTGTWGMGEAIRCNAPRGALRLDTPWRTFVMGFF